MTFLPTAIARLNAHRLRSAEPEGWMMSETIHQTVERLSPAAEKALDPETFSLHRQNSLWMVSNGCGDRQLCLLIRGLKRIRETALDTMMSEKSRLSLILDLFHEER